MKKYFFKFTFLSFFTFVCFGGPGRPRGVLGLNIKNTNFQKKIEKIEKKLKKNEKIEKKIEKYFFLIHFFLLFIALGDPPRQN